MSQDFTKIDWIYLPEPTDDISFPVTLKFKNDSLHLYNFGSDRVFSIGCQSHFTQCVVETDSLQITNTKEELFIQSKALNYKFKPLETIKKQVVSEPSITMDNLINQSFTYGTERLQIVFMDSLFDQGIVGAEYRNYVKSYVLFTKNGHGLTFYDDGIWAIHERSGIKILVLQGMMFPVDWYILKTINSNGMSLLKSKDSTEINFSKTANSPNIDLNKILDSEWVISSFEEYKKEFHTISYSFQDPNSPIPISHSDLIGAKIQLEFKRNGKYSVTRQQELLDYGDWLTVPGNSNLIQIISRNDSQVGGIQYCRFINIKHSSQEELQIYTELGIQVKDNIKHIPMLLTFKKK
ncbi:hypothetical protein [Roseivirga thermotolerans]|nr:hypothetical protein [Roseivirga thermotolerans]